MSQEIECGQCGSVRNLEFDDYEDIRYEDQRDLYCFKCGTYTTYLLAIDYVILAKRIVI